MSGSSFLSTLSRRSSSVSFPTPDTLTDACSSSNLKVVQKAIERGLRPDGNTLTTAFLTRDIQIIDAVVKQGATPNEKTLTIACSTQLATLVRKALSLGAKATEDTFKTANFIKNQTLLDLIALAPRITTARRDSLRAGSSTEKTERDNELTTAVKEGDFLKVVETLAKKVPPQKFTLLRGVESGNLKIVQALWEAEAKPHADPEAAPDELTLAFQTKKLGIASYLFTKGMQPGTGTLSAAFGTGDQDFVLLALQIKAQPDENTLNRALLGFIDEGNAVYQAIDQALRAKAMPNESTLDIAIRHVQDLIAPGALINYLHQKAKAEPSPNTLTLACQCPHSNFTSYESLLQATLLTGAKADKETFGSIRWIGQNVSSSSSENQRQFHLENRTVNDLFNAGLKPTKEELEHLQSKIIPIKKEKKSWKEEEIKQNGRNEFYTLILTVAEGKSGAI